MAVVAGALAVPLIASAVADAATYCVNDATCAGTPEPTIAVALGAAQATADEDAVRIGPGTYSGNQSYVGSSPIHIIGAGRKRTKLAVPINHASGFHVTVPSDGSSIRSLTMALPPGEGLGLAVQHVDVRRVNVSGPKSAAAVGMRLTGGSLHHSKITFPPQMIDDGNEGISAILGTRISDVSVKATLGIGGGGYSDPPRIARARITVVPGGQPSRVYTPELGVGGDARVRDSLIDLKSGGAGLATGGGSEFNLPPPNAELDADHVTIIGGGSTGFAVSALSYGGVSQTSTGTLTNSVIDGPTSAITRYAQSLDSSTMATANVTTDHSSYDASTDQDVNNANGAGSITETNRVLGTPSFVDPSAGNFRPAAGSVLVDSGDPAFTPQPGETDLDGGARVFDGDGDGTAVTDVGAYEREDLAPSVEITSGPQGMTRNRNPRFKFRSDDPLATFECSLDSNPYRPCSSPRRYHDLGLGHHRFRVRPTDPYGNVGKRARRRFRIVG